VLSQWTLEQIVTAYRMSEAECIKYFAQLDRIGIIELRPMNRYRLKLAKTFRRRSPRPTTHRGWRATSSPRSARRAPARAHRGHRVAALRAHARNQQRQGRRERAHALDLAG
jgi:hypothetical protein